MNIDEITKKMTETTRMMIDSIAELQKINDATVRALAKQQLEAIEEFNSVSSRQLDALGDVKNPKDLIAIQAKIAAEVAEDLKSNTVRALEVLNQGQSELKAFLDRNVRALMEQAKLNP
ncbi:MAG: phasin family protein [Magnetococcales bacterium]|nr:phasin family protein [Magnetococcales bacterium]